MLIIYTDKTDATGLAGPVIPVGEAGSTDEAAAERGNDLFAGSRPLLYRRDRAIHVQADGGQ